MFLWVHVGQRLRELRRLNRKSVNVWRQTMWNWGPSPNNTWPYTRPANRKEQILQCRPTTQRGRRSYLIQGAKLLDSRRQEQVQEEDTTINNNNQRRKKIKIQIHGSWVDVFVDVVLLQEALGLPAHDIFNAGIFHQYRHNKTVGPDIADTDHGGTLENDENDSNGDPDNDNDNNATS